jgi:hypothetical protein
MLRDWVIAWTRWAKAAANVTRIGERAARPEQKTLCPVKDAVQALQALPSSAPQFAP